MERFAGRFVSNTRRRYNTAKKHTFPVIEERYRKLEEHNGDWTCLPVSGLLDRLAFVVRHVELSSTERHAQLAYASSRRGGEDARESHLQVR